VEGSKNVIVYAHKELIFLWLKVLFITLFICLASSEHTKQGLKKSGAPHDIMQMCETETTAPSLPHSHKHP